MQSRQAPDIPDNAERISERVTMCTFVVYNVPEGVSVLALYVTEALVTGHVVHERLPRDARRYMKCLHAYRSTHVNIGQLKYSMTRACMFFKRRLLEMTFKMIFITNYHK